MTEDECGYHTAHKTFTIGSPNPNPERYNQFGWKGSQADSWKCYCSFTN